jgi:hypothetical protein
MADGVVDIRKRIEEMRNEVSAAIVSRQELEDATYAVGQAADITLGKQSVDPGARSVNDGYSPIDAATKSSSAKYTGFG